MGSRAEGLRREIEEARRERVIEKEHCYFLDGEEEQQDEEVEGGQKHSGLKSATNTRAHTHTHRTYHRRNRKMR